MLDLQKVRPRHGMTLGRWRARRRNDYGADILRSVENRAGERRRTETERTTIRIGADGQATAVEVDDG